MKKTLYILLALLLFVTAVWSLSFFHRFAYITHRGTHEYSFIIYQGTFQYMTFESLPESDVVTLHQIPLWLIHIPLLAATLLVLLLYLQRRCDPAPGFPLEPKEKAADARR